MKNIFRNIIRFYLRFLTRIVLWRHRPLIVAVAGTTNKTFVKERILDELGRGPAVRGNPKSFNTEIGLPLAVLFLPSGYSSLFRWVDVLLTGTTISLFSREFPKILVLELGVDRKGDMEYLLSMIKPQMALITGINRSFPDTETSMDDIAEEMAYLAKRIPKDGLLVINGDDERVRKLSSVARAKIVTVGEKDCFSAKIDNIEEHKNGQNFCFHYGEAKEEVKTGRFGKHNIYALAMAKVVAEEVKKIKQKYQQDAKNK